jgi:thioredoxin 1
VTTVLTDATFDEHVLSAAKPVLIDFWAQWCGPCKTVAPIVDELGVELADHLSVASIDIDANPDVAMRFAVMSVPTLLLIDNGEVVFQVVGARPKPRLLAELEPHLHR